MPKLVLEFEIQKFLFEEPRHALSNFGVHSTYFECKMIFMQEKEKVKAEDVIKIENRPSAIRIPSGCKSVDFELIPRNKNLSENYS